MTNYPPNQGYPGRPGNSWHGNSPLGNSPLGNSQQGNSPIPGPPHLNTHQNPMFAQPGQPQFQFQGNFNSPNLRNSSQRKNFLLIGIAIAVVAMFIAILLVLRPWADKKTTPDVQAESSSSSLSSSTETTPATIAVMAASLLPTEQEIQTLTLVPVKILNPQGTFFDAQMQVTPTTCQNTIDLNGKNNAAGALTTASQFFSLTKEGGAQRIWASAAVFNTVEDAQKIFTSTHTAVELCTEVAFTESTKKVSWTVEDKQLTADNLSWKLRQTDSWTCAISYRTIKNVVLSSQKCSASPNDRVSAVTEAMLTKIPK